MKLSSKELRHLVSLTKIKLSENEAKRFQEQISNILTFVDQLKEVDVSGVSALKQIGGEINNWRPDKKFDGNPEQRKNILKGAPETKDGFIKVPGVFNKK